MNRPHGMNNKVSDCPSTSVSRPKESLMKAAIYTNYGPPDVVRVVDVEKPVPKPNEVLVKVHATTVNRTDCGFRKPEYFIIIRLVNGILKPRKKILGSEFAGDVEAVGKDVKSMKKGDRVFGLTTAAFGAHAEYVCVPEQSSIAPMPTNMDYEEAAAVCDGLMLAFNYLKEIDFQNRKSILIYGASGSIGTAAVQLSRYYGADITAVCNTRNLDLVKSLGADRVVDYTKGDFTKTEMKYDVVLDAVGKVSFFRCRSLMKDNGIYFSTDLGFLGQNVFLPLWTALFGGKKVKFPLPGITRENVEFFKDMIEKGKYRAVIDRRYPLERIVEAYTYVETEEKAGNVVVTVGAGN